MCEIHLKPCPFCGATVKLHAYYNGIFVRCPACDVRMQSSAYKGGPTSVAKWNARATAEGMTLNEYQRLAQRTSSDDPGLFGTAAAKKIDNGVLGMAGEGGECADIWKKYLHQGHPFDKGKMIKEAGDVLWYIAELAAGLGLTLEEIATRNIEKLSNRYPDGHFDAERSIHREGTED